MKKKKLQPMYLVGRDFTLKELKLIKEIVKLYPGLSRTELSKTICENISWEAPTGTNKYNSCLKALEKLEGKGYIKLPPWRLPKARRRTPITITERSDPEGLIESRIDQWGRVTINGVEREQVGLWNEYVYRYHYLGYKSSFGLHQKYFIKSEDQLLGCILYSCAAWALECRDRWIGWTSKERERNLSRIINMNRFLIFPWVRIKNLGSYALSVSAKQIQSDWEKVFGYKPVLLESFVDARFHGTCYRAANWMYLGKSKGRGRQDRYNKGLSSIKDVYVYVLKANFKKELAQ